MPLVLKRKRGERVRLTLPDGRYVWLAVDWKHNGNAIDLLIDAPQDVDIAREEVLIAQERKRIQEALERRSRAKADTAIIPTAAIHRELIEAADSEGGED